MRQLYEYVANESTLKVHFIVPCEQRLHFRENVASARRVISLLLLHDKFITVYINHNSFALWQFP